jgi:hypothetical protein
MITGVVKPRNESLLPGHHRNEQFENIAKLKANIARRAILSSAWIPKKRRLLGICIVMDIYILNRKYRHMTMIFRPGKGAIIPHAFYDASITRLHQYRNQ